MIKQSKLLFFVILFVLMSINVFAISIGPTGQSAPYNPGSTGGFTFQIGGCPCTILLEGDLASNATIEGGSNEIDGSQPLKVWLTIPELSPGKHYLWVHATEKIDKKYGQSMVGAITSAKVAVKVKVPYPTKYLEVGSLLDVSKGNEINKPVFFSLPIENMGGVVLEKVDGNVTIYEGQLSGAKKVATVTLAPIKGLSPASQDTLLAEWIPAKDTVPGIYSAQATVTWDDGSTQRDRSFLVGKPELKIISLEPVELPLNEITKSYVKIKSVWNQPIELTVSTKLFDEREIEKMSIRSATEKIDAWTTKDVPIFMDTHNLEEKNYSAVVEVEYLTYTAQENFTVSVFKSVSTPTVPAVIEEKEKQFNILPVTGVIIILLLTSVLILMYNRKDINSKRDKNEF